jgi:subtilase family serine protease
MRVRVFAAPVMAFAALMLASAPAGAHPLHWFYPRSFSQPPTTAQCEATTAPLNLACYSPAQIREAYNMKPLYGSGLKGQGQTIVIVDSYGSPTIRSDLQSFDQSYGLPAPPSLKIIQPAGTPPAYDPNDSDMGGWAFETSLDVEWAHTMAPDANILLVETPTDETEGVQGLPQMVEAENYVVDHNLGDVISQSFGATEETFPNAQSIYNLRSAYKNAAAHHVTVLAAAGDAGATDDELDALDYYPQRAIDWPSSDPLDTSVGGTQLHLDSSGVRTAPDNVWNDTTLLGDPASGGGGISSVFGRPSYQDGVAGAVGSSRGTPDVAMSAAVDGGVNVYIGFTNPAYGVAPGWYIVGGTSEASPLTSGIVAIADQAAGHRLGLLNPKLYALGDG